MNVFLAELGKKLAERWVALLLLPGALFCGTALLAALVGHGLEVPRSDGLAGLSWQTSLVVVIAVLVGSTAAGFLARAVNAVLVRLWLVPWPDWAGRALVKRRARRWDAAARAYEDLVAAGASQRALDDAAARRNRLCLVPPRNATWCADRLVAADTRLWSWYRLDVSSAWHHIWLLMEDTEQRSISEVRDRLDRATGLAGWGVLYTALGLWSWPLAIVGAVVVAVGRHRARAHTNDLAALVEAVFDLHGPDLAEALGHPVPDRRLDPETGLQITAQLRKHS